MSTGARRRSTEVDVVVVGLGPAARRLRRLGRSGLDGRRGRRAPGRRRVPVLRLRADQDDDPRRPTLLAEARRVHELAGAATVAPDWAPVAERIRDEATDDWDDQVAVERLDRQAAHGSSAARGALAGDGTRRGRRRRRSRRDAGVVLNTGTAPAVPPIDGLAGHAVLDQPRRRAARPSCPASLVVHRRRRDRAASSRQVVRPVRRRRCTVVEVADRLLALEEPEASERAGRGLRREGIQVLTGRRRSDAVDARRRHVHGRRCDDQAVDRREAAGRRRAARRTSPTSAWRRSASTRRARRS